ncbi:trypsin eta-like [Leguminivora glycinivorella]|uniref:trypsin eta-like n=1 Tax=Leguminivora glycinivorella TaxID=1035111 RepID=UPI0020102AFC|nr:trypsin eta-like [Leguminivora glycinivorella]
MYFLIILSALVVINATEEARVYNGNDLDPTEQGYLVLLHILTEANVRIKCSGCIIASNWILTTAHCLPTQKRVKIIYVRQYVHQVLRTLAQVKPNNTFPHSSYVQGDYTIANTQYDIALLKTSKKIPFDEYAKSIELARASPRNNQSAIIAGYGLNDLGESLARQGVVRVTKCPFTYSERLLCSNSTVKSGHGDSGGALAANGKLIGVVAGSSVRNCGETDPETLCTTVYVNVASHYKWIDNVKRTHV